MKHIKSLIPTIITATLIFGCNSTKEISDINDTVSTPSSEKVTEITLVSETPAVSETSHTTSEEPHDDFFEVPVSFPVIGGMEKSSNALDASVRAAYTGLFTAEELKQYLIPSSGTVSKLLEREIDAFYQILSDDTVKTVIYRNETIESIPVIKDALVFIVNKNNPVKSLTQDQLRDIFTGKITNWSEVGGNDAEIKVYTRNKDTGSSAFLQSFAGNEKLVQGVQKYSAYKPLESDAALYADDINAIGVSVFSYINNMSFAVQKPKMIAVDGIAPDLSSITDGIYPLIEYKYFTYLSDTTNNSEVRKLAKFISSDKCQDSLKSDGFIPAYNSSERSSHDVVRTVIKGFGKVLSDDDSEEEKLTCIKLNNIAQDGDIIENVTFRLLTGNIYFPIGDISFKSGISADSKCSLISDGKWYMFPDTEISTQNSYYTVSIDIPEEVKKHIDIDSDELMIGDWYADTESDIYLGIEVTLRTPSDK